MFEVVIEEFPVSERNEYPERTIMRLEDGEVHTIYEHLVDGEWEVWEDMGSAVSVGNFMIFAGLLENSAVIAEAAKKASK
jgi:hypothetical protein